MVPEAVTPLVFLHPIGLDREIWRDVAPEAAVTLELPGFGETPAADDLTMATLSDWVLAEVGEPATYVGLSLGGMVALQLAVRAPEAVRSIVVACSNAGGNPDVQLGRARDTLARGLEGMMEMTLDRWFSEAALAADAHPGVAYARRRLLADDPEVVAAYWTAMAGHDVRDQLPAIAVPASIIAGTGDKASSEDGLRTIAETIPGGRFTAIDGPHMLPLEQPARFAALVAEHCAWVDGGDLRRPAA
jgi:3-oxoadipate enol-lactonase